MNEQFAGGITSISDLRTIRDYIRWSLSQFEANPLFFGHGTDNSWDEAVALVFAALKLPWDILEKDPQILQARLTEQEADRIYEWVCERVTNRTPLPYITGEAWFAGLPFNVDSRVLIPRSPIAELLQSRLSPWISEEAEPTRILDLCTGSGALAVTAAMNFPEAEVDAIDISEGAIEVSMGNVARHQLQDQVKVIESDLFEQVSGQYDLIVSNPPYVGAEEMSQLPAEFLKEPTLALETEENGMQIVRKILEQAREYLTDTGLLIVEVGNTEPLVKEAYPALPLVWLEFEHGGEGVFLIKAADLQKI